MDLTLRSIAPLSDSLVYSRSIVVKIVSKERIDNFVLLFIGSIKTSKLLFYTITIISRGVNPMITEIVLVK